MYFPLLETILLIFLTILVVNVFFRALNLPVIFGYIIVGVLVGPHSLAWITNVEAIKDLAEFGVVLLMFTIGLEFSVTKLKTLKYAVFVLGGLQVLISVGITVLIGFCLGMSMPESIIIGGVVAMSSTALVMKQLSVQNEIHYRHGLNAVGVLLFQDLAVVPIFIIIAGLSGTNGQSLSQTLLISLVNAILAIVVILSLGRWVLKPLLHSIVKTHADDLFTLAVLFVAIGSAWITGRLGMTYALGAFLSGIMLAETEFQQQIKNEIKPFRDVLLSLFFVSIGMLANVKIWVAAWSYILLTLFALMIGKAILVTGLCYLSRYERLSALRTGFILAQGGEFGFAILALALGENLLPWDYGQVVLAALLISFASAPVIIRHNQWLAFHVNRLIKPRDELL